MSRKSKVKIVFYGHCGKRSSFALQTDAEKAAVQYSRQAGYTCETFLCGKHSSESGRRTSRWHVRAKTWPVVRHVIQGVSFQSSTVPEQL
jgi:hypothetical protein